MTLRRRSSVELLKEQNGDSKIHEEKTLFDDIKIYKDQSLKLIAMKIDEEDMFELLSQEDVMIKSDTEHDLVSEQSSQENDGREVTNSSSRTRLIDNITEPNVEADNSGVSTTPPSSAESLTIIFIQLLIPFIVAGLGMVAAGLVLDKVQHWDVFEVVNELFILVPALLGLKGNLEMTLASRLSTHANLGHTHNHWWQIVKANLALIQCQAIGVAILASIFAILTGYIVSSDSNTIELGHAMLLCAASISTASLASFILGCVMASVVWFSHKINVNPDNIATPIAASLGDLTTLALLSCFATLLFDDLSKDKWLSPLIILLYVVIILPVSIYLADGSVYTHEVLRDGWSPVINAMLISSIGGIVLNHAVDKFKGIAVFQPVMNGVGGNLVAVQASRISTDLHKSTADQNCDSLSVRSDRKPTAGNEPESVQQPPENTAGKCCIDREPTSSCLCTTTLPHQESGQSGSVDVSESSQVTTTGLLHRQDDVKNRIVQQWSSSSEISADNQPLLSSSSDNDSNEIPSQNVTLRNTYSPSHSYHFMWPLYGWCLKSTSKYDKYGRNQSNQSVTVTDHSSSICTIDRHWRTAQLLLFMVLPGHLVFTYLIAFIHAGHTSPTFVFLLFYMSSAVFQVYILLTVAHHLVHGMWKRGIDPDSSAIPYLTALGDLVGSFLLWAAFETLFFIGDKDSDVGD